MTALNDQVEALSMQAPSLTGPVLMNQDWRDLTYVHWALDPGQVADRLPPGVRPDCHEGRTFVGLVPFRMVDAGPGRHARVPWLGSFLETNIRLYTIDAAGRRGVVFLSLDCDRLLVAGAARSIFAVPYRWARMSYGRKDDTHTYRSRRRGLGRRPTTSLTVRVGARRQPDPTDLFVSARWGLHTRILGRTTRVPNAHEPWPLHDAEVTDLEPGLLVETGFGHLADRPPDHVAFSPGVHAEFGLPRSIRSARGEVPA